MLVPRRRNNNQAVLRLSSAGHSSRFGRRFAGPRLVIDDGVGPLPNACFPRRYRPQGFIEMLARLYGRDAELPTTRFSGGDAREPLLPSRRRLSLRNRSATDPLCESRSIPGIPEGMSPADMLEQLAGFLGPSNVRTMRRYPSDFDPGRIIFGHQQQPLLPILPSPVVHGRINHPTMVIHDGFDHMDDVDMLVLIQALQEQYSGDQRTQDMIEDVLAIYGINAQDLPDEYLWYP